MTLEHSPFYYGSLLFFALYPMLSSIVWTSTALTYFARREYGGRGSPPRLYEYPMVSVLIAAYREEVYIEQTLIDCLAIDYPNFEVVLIDDGSTDNTIEKARALLFDKRLRLIVKEQNEGKAMALNDAIPCLRGDIIVVMDADASPDPQLLRHLVPHFESPRVAAVTGNPRVVDRDTLLAKLQILEFTSIVSLLRRAQRVWGRILTMSGVVTALRKSAVVDVGLFSPDMATEDIDLTWKLQMRYYDVRYEPSAVVWMRVPRTFRALWSQRRRWALGLAQVLRRHAPEVLRWRRRRMWPVVFESALSIVWAYTFVSLTGIWILSYAIGLPPVGASPFPNWWGMVIASLSLMQLAVGVLLDRQHDKSVIRFYPYAIFYPLVYWMLMAFITVITSPKALRKPRRAPATWHTERQAAPTTVAV